MPLVVAIHNFEEYLGFEAYASRRGLRVTLPQLQIALILATVLPLSLILLARHSPKQSRRMVLGFLVPAIFATNAVSHVGQTIFFRDYAPGTATAVALNVPFALVLYRDALRMGYLTPQQAHQTLVWGSLVMAPSAVILQGIGAIGARLLQQKRCG
jgi:hypothetical protein